MEPSRLPFTFSLSRLVTLRIPPFVHLPPRSPANDDLLACQWVRDRLAIKHPREIQAESFSFDFAANLVIFWTPRELLNSKRRRNLAICRDEWHILESFRSYPTVRNCPRADLNFVVVSLKLIRQVKEELIKSCYLLLEKSKTKKRREVFDQRKPEIQWKSIRWCSIAFQNNVCARAHVSEFGE